MKTDDLITSIESADSLDQLTQIMHAEVQRNGFHSFGFMHTRSGPKPETFYVTTTTDGWVQDYIANDFVAGDPCAAFARRTNQPFTWSSTPLPKGPGVRKPLARKIMDAAADHSFRDGLVVPCHYTDALGRHYSSSAVAYWTDDVGLFRRVIKKREYQLQFQLIMIYWATRAMNLVARDKLKPRELLDGEGQSLEAASLTDRERESLIWAAYGKTVIETAIILGISRETVVSHLSNAQRKLNCSNKTHTVATALMLKLIAF